MPTDRPGETPDPLPSPLQAETFHSGFVALVGKPNVGKSTLVNQLVRSPVSITSSKPQTTRRRVLGVVHGDGYQIVLVDTPGVAKARHALGKTMVRTAQAEGRQADIILFVVELTHKPTEEDREALALVGDVKAPILMVGNKVDLARKPEDLLPLLDAYSKLGDFQEVLPVSATSRANLDKLELAIVARLPEGDPFFPEDMLSDQDQQARVEEVIRAQVLEHTRQEVPHAVAVKVEDMQPGDNPEILLIRAHLFVEKPTQKRILVGKKGALLKTIGQRAREQLEQELGRRIYLDLWVKVKEDWRDREDWLRALGYQ